MNSSELAGINNQLCNVLMGEKKNAHFQREKRRAMPKRERTIDDRRNGFLASKIKKQESKKEEKCIICFGAACELSSNKRHGK